ncbi:MAG: hypothetical protein ABIT16_09925 [Croceibacterium sp.]
MAQEAVQPAPPAATEPSPDATNAPIVVEAQKEKKICHNETSTGSVMPRRVCRTATQVAEQQAAAQRSLDAARRSQETDDLTRELREGGAL